VFLSLIYQLIRQVDRLELARLVQCAVGALLAPLAAWLGLQLGLRGKAALATGLLMGFYPILILYPIGLASENLFIPLLAAGTASLLWASQSSSPWRAILPGVLFAGAMLTRSVLLLPVLLAGIGFAWVGKSRWRGSIVMLAVALGLCLPWSVRNSLVSGRPVFLETSLGYQMYIGYHPDGNGTFITAIAAQPMRILDDAARDQFCTQAVISFIRDDPIEMANRIVQRLGYFFGVEDRELIYFYSNGFFNRIPQPWLTLAYLVIVVPWMAICLLAPWGILAAASSRGSTALVLLLALGYLIPHLLIIAEPRFHLALVPLLIPLAVLGWLGRPWSVSTWKQTLQAAPAGPWLGMAFQIMLIVIWIWGYARRWSLLLGLFSPGGESLELYY
jgi:4-amino-4-deoxy-L-arabinose transferase-like glycosyltransferase